MNINSMFIKVFNINVDNYKLFINFFINDPRILARFFANQRIYVWHLYYQIYLNSCVL